MLNSGAESSSIASWPYWKTSHVMDSNWWGYWSRLAGCSATKGPCIRSLAACIERAGSEPNGENRGWVHPESTTGLQTRADTPSVNFALLGPASAPLLIQYS